MLEQPFPYVARDSLINAFLDTAQPITGTWTLHHLMIVVSAILAAVTTLLSFGLGFLHLINYTNPAEQRQ